MRKSLLLVSAFSLLLTINVWSQERTVSGQVTSAEDGSTLPGVNVVVKGTSTGVVTDIDGNYKLSVSEGATIVFSFIGLESMEMVVGNQSTINVQMISDVTQLGEIVVTGYGMKRDKKSLGFSQQSVGGETLVKARETDFANALAGKISGIQIVGNSSSTFSASSMKLRGETDLLYVVDGIKIYSISDINTDNIANISVLKGAAATAIYGPDGKSGVVIMTSKVAAPGTSTFEINQSFTVNNIATLPEYQNEYGGGYQQTWNTFAYNAATDPASWASFDGHKIPEFHADESWGPKLDGTLVRHWDSWILGTPEFGQERAWSPQPDNIRDFYQSANTSNTTLAFSKADANYAIRTTLSKVYQTGVIGNSSNDYTKFALNASYNVNEKFKFTTVFNYEDKHTKNNPDQGYANLASNFNQWWQRQLDMDRLEDYERNGQVVSWNIKTARNPAPLYWDMPFFNSYENFLNNYKNTAFGKISGEYEFNDKIKAIAELRKTFHSYLTDDRRTTISLLETGYYTERQTRNERDEYFGMVTYADNYMGDNLDMNVSVGGEIINDEYKRLSSNTGGDLTIPDFYNLAGSKDPISSTNSKTLRRTNSMFVRGSFGYQSMLYLDGSYRMDWSSTARAEDNRVNSYGASLSFLAHEVFPTNDILTFAKLRAGIANAPYFPNPYNVSSVYNVGSLYNGFGRLSVAGRQNNPELIGGNRSEFEVGAELQLFKSKVSLDFSYFNRIDSEIPITVPLDGSTGYTSIVLNAGKQTSSGLEIGLTGDVISTGNIKWDIGVNFGTLTKFVDELYEGIESVDISSYTSNLKLQKRVGEEWGLFYGRGFARDANGTMMFKEISAGRYRYSRQPNMLLGSLLPDFTGGITSNLSYKNFDLNLGFDFQKGGLYYSRTERYITHSGLSAETAGLNDKGNPKRDAVADGGGVHIVGVLETGGDAVTGDPISDGTVVDTYVDAQDIFSLGNIGNIYENNVHDASYIKLRTVRVNYNFNPAVVEKLRLQKASLGVFANNVWLIYADVPWIDPSEIEKRSGYNWAEAGQLPDTRSIGVNLQLTF